MQLNANQLSILKEIGIPVWELRPVNQASQADNLVSEPDDQFVTKRQYQHAWIIVVDSLDANSAQQRLLYAMLKSINVPVEDVAVVTTTDYAQIELVPSNNKLMLVLGDNAYSCVKGEPSLIEQNRGGVHQYEIATIASYGLDQLLSDTAKKAMVWQDLLVAKQHYEQLVSA